MNDKEKGLAFQEENFHLHIKCDRLTTENQQLKDQVAELEKDVQVHKGQSLGKNDVITTLATENQQLKDRVAELENKS
jgi:cell division septum initiation protein DivIVA